uniref:Uncharacterized protein n=1 Tax=Arcella intermedia TaxID=1963864 RepID=A0A6B2LAC2_9EUKA
MLGMTTEVTKSIQQKLEGAIKDGDFYQAQQIYKSIYHRLAAKKNYTSLRSTVLKGIKVMLLNNQTTNATELALLLLDNYKQTSVPVEKEYLDPLIEIFNAYPSTDPTNRRLFVNNAINWSSLPSNNSQGSPVLHLAFAQKYSQELFSGNTTIPVEESSLLSQPKVVIVSPLNFVTYHYLRADNPVEHAQVIKRWDAEIRKEEELDVIVARAILQYLCLENLKNANLFFNEISKFLKPDQTKMMRFVKYLLPTLERNAYPLFQLLRDKFTSEISKDEAFDKYLDLIGKIYFGVENQNQGFGSLFSSLIKSFMDGN